MAVDAKWSGARAVHLCTIGNGSRKKSQCWIPSLYKATATAIHRIRVLHIRIARILFRFIYALHLSLHDLRLQNNKLLSLYLTDIEVNTLCFNIQTILAFLLPTFQLFINAAFYIFILFYIVFQVPYNGFAY